MAATKRVELIVGDFNDGFLNKSRMAILFRSLDFTQTDSETTHIKVVWLDQTYFRNN